MKVLRRYIGTTIIVTILLVLLIIVVLNSLALIMEQVGDIRANYDFAHVLQYVAWRTPGYLVSNVGFAALIGCLIGLGILANNNELTVVRASGVSIAQIMWLVMRPVLLVIVIGMILGEVVPYADRIAEGSRDIALATTNKKSEKSIRLDIDKKNVSESKLKNKLKDNIKKTKPRLHISEDVRQKKNIWNRGDNEFIRFATVLPNGKVYGVTRFGFNDDKLLAWMQYAEEGTYQRDGWLLENIQTTYFDKTLRKEKLKTLYWTTKLTPEILTFVSTNPESLTFNELDRYEGFLTEQQRDSRAYQLEWWKKIVKPFEIFSLVLIAISFVFGPLRQVTVGQRVFVGVMVGVIFQTLQNMFATSSLVFGFDPLVAVTLPIAVCALVGIGMLTRLR